MIEIVPGKVESAFLYFHSAGIDSRQFKPFLRFLQTKMPHCYIWIGDGGISGSPLAGKNTFYGGSDERYWFMFPMQDAMSRDSFYDNREAMGASLMSSGSFVNRLVDDIKKRFDLRTENILLSGFQHGSSLVLASAMMRKADPLKQIILFEPYLLEAYYLKEESIVKETTVICVDNSHIRKRTFDWLGIYTNEEFAAMGLQVKSIVVEEGDEQLDWKMIESALSAVRI